MDRSRDSLRTQRLRLADRRVPLSTARGRRQSTGFTRSSVPSVPSPPHAPPLPEIPPPEVPFQALSPALQSPSSPTRRHSVPCTLAPKAPFDSPGRRRSAPALDDDDNTCVICFESPGGVRLEPCGHSLFCQACARKVRKCPLCRADMTSWQDGSTQCVFGTAVWL